MKKTIVRTALVAGALCSVGAWATNGYYSHGYGPVSKSMAGACVAMVENVMCGVHNPASLVHLDSRWEIGAALFSPDRGFHANDDFQSPPYASVPPGKYESNNKLFLIPFFAYNRKLDEDSSVSLLFGGQGGMNTEYDAPVWGNFTPPGAPAFFQATAPTGVNLMQMYLGAAYGRKVGGGHSLSIMPILAAQMIKVDGLEPFRGVSIAPNKVTNNGDDWSFGGGARFGWLWQATDKLNLGASYQTRLWMTSFDEYKGLFAGGGEFDIAPVLDLGLAYDITPAWTASLAYQYIWYEDIDSLSNPADLVMMPGVPVLGTDNGLGFGWKNQNVYKFGLRWKYSPDLTFRAGYSHGDQVVPDSQALFNVLAPAVVQDHYTFGFSKTFASNNEFHMSFMYAPEETVSGTNPNTGPQTGDIYMSQWDIELGWVFKM